MSRESIGQVLKHEREERRLSIEEVSSTTRIPRRTLESLEQDRFEDLPSGVFVRGFIKAYASAVHIDAGDVLARFDEQRPKTLPPAPLRRFGVGGDMAPFCWQLRRQHSSPSSLRRSRS